MTKISAIFAMVMSITAGPILAQDGGIIISGSAFTPSEIANLQPQVKVKNCSSAFACLMDVTQSDTIAKISLVDSLTVFPTLAGLQTPYAWGGIDTLGATMQSKIIDDLDAHIQELTANRIHLIGLSAANGWYSLATTDRKIRKFDTIAGLRIAIPPNPTQAAFLQALGATPVLMSPDQMPIELGFGSIDGLYLSDTDLSAVLDKTDKIQNIAQIHALPVLDLWFMSAIQARDIGPDAVDDIKRMIAALTTDMSPNSASNIDVYATSDPEIKAFKKGLEPYSAQFSPIDATQPDWAKELQTIAKQFAAPPTTND